MNPRPIPWQGIALPLCYIRKADFLPDLKINLTRQAVITFGNRVQETRLELAASSLEVKRSTLGAIPAWNNWQGPLMILYSFTSFLYEVNVIHISV